MSFYSCLLFLRTGGEGDNGPIQGGQIQINVSFGVGRFLQPRILKIVLSRNEKHHTGRKMSPHYGASEVSCHCVPQERDLCAVLCQLKGVDDPMQSNKPQQTDQLEVSCLMIVDTNLISGCQDSNIEREDTNQVNPEPETKVVRGDLFSICHNQVFFIGVGQIEVDQNVDSEDGQETVFDYRRRISR